MATIVIVTIIVIKISNRRVVKGKQSIITKATKEYEKYTDGQLDKFLDGTEKFVAIKADDMDKAKELYPKVRMYYERSEPVAEAFGDLDPKIDARLADMKEEKKKINGQVIIRLRNHFIKIIK